jgi:hypothetical protein
MFTQTLRAQAMAGYQAALNSPAPDWRAVAESFRAAVQSTQDKRKRGRASEFPDYNVDRVKLLCRSPRIAVRFMDGEANIHARPFRAGQAVEHRPGVARGRRHVPLAQGRAAARRLR